MRLHVTQEVGVDPEEKAGPMAVAVSWFLLFSLGAVGLFAAGAVASVFTARSWWWAGGLRQWLFGARAASATYGVGSMLGAGFTG